MPKIQPKLPIYKNFNGKVFTKSIHSYEYKSNANDSVIEFRKKGHFARKIKFGKRWYIYYKSMPRLQILKRQRKIYIHLSKQKREAKARAKKQRKTMRKKQKSKRRK